MRDRFCVETLGMAQRYRHIATSSVLLKICGFIENLPEVSSKYDKYYGRLLDRQGRQLFTLSVTVGLILEKICLMP